jgi:hypothetical protein
MSVFENQPIRTTMGDKEDMSTAAKFYDLEESQRRYQELVDENMWLKQQIERSRPVESAVRCPQCSDCAKEKPINSNSNGDTALWSMLERNKYL